MIAQDALVRAASAENLLELTSLRASSNSETVDVTDRAFGASEQLAHTAYPEHTTDWINGAYKPACSLISFPGA